MHTTVFEYGYLAHEKRAKEALGASLISQDAFSYLKEVSLSADEPETSKCLRLTKRYGVELLQVRNYVGVLFIPGGEHIEVLPKVGRTATTQKMAIEHSRELLLMMLQHLGAFRYISSNHASVATKQMPLLEVFIGQFLQSVNTLIKRGLKSDYLSQTDNLHFQKGKLLVSGQLRHNLINKHRFYVEYDEYLINRPANRLLKTALVKLSGITRQAANQKLLRELQFAFFDVPLCKSVKQDINALKLDRGMRDYHGPLAWAKLVLEGFSPLSMKGSAEALSLLFPMETVFENYVAAVLEKQLIEGAELKTQASSRYLVSHGDKQQFQLRPDLLITLADKKKVVLDTKWKMIDPQAPNYGLSQADFYQMFAYGHKYLHGSGDLVLIYPAHDKFNSPIQCSFDFSDELRLWVVPFVLDIQGDSHLIWPELMDKGYIQARDKHLVGAI